MCKIDKIIQSIVEIDKEIEKTLEPIQEKLDELNKKKAVLENQINEAAFEKAKEDLKNKDYGCGTSTIKTNSGFTVKTEIKKKVTWDQNVLKIIADKMKAAKIDPENYISYKLSVSETIYKSLPEKYKNEFKKARTVEPSKPSVKISMEV